MFGEGGVRDRATVLLAGRVESVNPLTNGLTGQRFWYVRVASFPGAVDVVTGAPEGEPIVGSIMLAHAWLVGRPAEDYVGQVPLLRTENETV